MDSTENSFIETNQNMFLDYNEFTEALGEYYNFDTMTIEQWEQINSRMMTELKKQGIDYQYISECDYDIFCKVGDYVCNLIDITKIN